MQIEVDTILYQQFLSYREFVLCSLTDSGQNDNNLCTMGTVKTKQKCPKCGKAFHIQNNIIVCKDCLIRPTRYFIDLHHKGIRYQLYSDKMGNILSSFEHAKRVEAEINTAIERHKFEPEDYKASTIQSKRFDTCLKKWLDDQQRRLELEDIAPTYHSKILSISNKYFMPFFSHMDIRDIRTRTIKDFYNQLPRTLKLKTIKNIITLLSKCLSDILKNEGITTNIEYPVIHPQEPARHWLDVEMQDRIYSFIPDRHKPIFMFLKETGTRPGESRAIWIEDINLNEKWARIWRNFSDNAYREVTKQKHERIIPLSDELVSMIKAMPVIPVKGFLFTDPKTGKPYTRRALNGIFERAKKKSGIESPVTMYQWGRHSWASQRVNAGIPLNLIGAFLGHTCSQTTRKYALMDLDGLRLALLKEPKAKIVKMRKDNKC